MSVKYSLRVLLLLLGSTAAQAEYGDFGYEPRYDEPPRESYREPGRTIPAKKVIIQNRKTIVALQRRVDELEERLNGVTSLMEGLNATIAEMKMAQSMRPEPAAEAKQPDNTQLLKELGLMIDKINDDYVSKDDLKQALAGKKFDTGRKHSAGSTSSSGKSSEGFGDKPTSKIYSEGVRLFVKQRYNEAEKRFVITDRKGYKPAASNYYLGEIAYYTKKYEDAIFFYKKSASLYDQASYMDVLLLHTAISLEKTGEKGEAKIFYQNIIDNYADRKSAKIAKERLKKLK